MSRGINKVIIVGNVGADPEVRYMSSGDPVANVSIATSDVWKDKQSGQNQERTEWHKVVFYGKTADIVQRYVRKGTKLYIEGSLRTRKWQDKSGQDRYTTEIIGNEMQMLDGNKNQQGERTSSGPSDYNSSQDRRPAYNSSFNDSAALTHSDLDEELPF